MQATDTDDIARKHLQSVQKHTADDDLDTRTDDYQAFRVDPQVRPSNALLDFWFANGDQRAISYNHLYDVEFTPPQLVLTFSQHQIEIEGEHLLDLYNNLKRHRIVYIWEADHTEANQASNDEPVVRSIKVRDLTES